MLICMWGMGAVKDDDASFGKNTLESYRGSFPALRSQKAYILRSNKQDWILPCICSIRKTIAWPVGRSLSKLRFLSLAKQSSPSHCFLPQIPNGFSILLGNLKITSVNQGMESSGRISY